MKQKKVYESPMTGVVELKTEGILCLSDPKYYNPFSGGGEDW